ncbi:protein of unknown function DUF1535 [Xylanimonas cellulosilytica DSM 15894]|uniref:Putative host cell surface-exposed lipoprotein Ltp-like HTH region domain-containing protein n=1 Tax=Xylanimonas cellulosilytica (strain DSM 15894 / JCM 12276 / CECT 5975 / KCTC 9989 / LMG 20990 / NBRC 107835 / XIL07) TaxID=446471 RepID=D1BWJ7_XYLCX|nr:Ltp family lipoprotein [Xylanimonas cellulosilytica]ACZ31542.1 protein of unknown function DUF1535 [Xylanimonas cellulosilytica DSM 15894]
MNALMKVRGTAWAVSVALVLVPLAGVAPAAAAEDAPPTIESSVLVAGTPTILGTPRVGEVLTVDPGPWTPDVPLSFQWSRDGVAIPEAIDATYTVVPADAGTSLTVTVTGEVEGAEPTSAISEPTAPVELGVLVATVPLVTGTARVGATLTAETAAWTPVATFTYQWLRDGDAIDGATASTYVPVVGDLSAELSVAVTGAADGYAIQTATSMPTASIVAGEFAQAPVPTISGAAQVGKTLTANVPAWTPAATFDYQWLRNGSPVGSATGATYTLAPSDLGAAITVRVTGTAVGFEPVTRTSSATSSVVAAAFVTAPVPTITGTAQVGKTLTAKGGTWSPAATLTYQWYRSGAVITGATKSTYVLAPADLAKAITVRVTGTAAGYATTVKTSAATTSVTAGTLTAKVPTISGTAQVGKTLTAVPGTWTPASTFTYQWFRSGAAISGATKRTYVLAAADRGKTITVKVTGTSPGYAKVTKASAATASVKVGALTAPAPVLPATVRVGLKTTVTTGAWTSGTKLTYQWVVGGKVVAGTRGTASTLTPTAAERGKTVTVRVTGTKAGYTTVTRTAKAKSIGYGVFTKAPTPKVSGTAKVGSTLSVSRGTWAPAPSGWAYQWRANGAAISGATRSTFKLTSAQRGKTITVTVTAKRTGYSNKAVTSAKTAVVVQAFTASPTPKISGTARVGSTLTATTGTWSPAPSFTYQWKANGTNIAGATGRTFKLTTAQQGKTITVTVTGKATNWVTQSRSSAATAKVAAAPLTALQTEALSRAQSYLKYLWFSRAGLIDQLKWEGYSTADATIAVDRTGTNWNSEAVGMARAYLDTMAFSRSGLVDQLLYEGFTAAQAEYGVANSGANWSEQAWLCAQEYLAVFPYWGWGRMVDQLAYEGFTTGQAQYGASRAGL